MACACFGAVTWRSWRLRALERHGAMDRVRLSRAVEHARLAAEMGGANEQEAEDGWKAECPGRRKGAEDAARCAASGRAAHSRSGGAQRFTASERAPTGGEQGPASQPAGRGHRRVRRRAGGARTILLSCARGQRPCLRGGPAPRPAACQHAAGDPRTANRDAGRPGQGRRLGATRPRLRHRTGNDPRNLRRFVPGGLRRGGTTRADRLVSADARRGPGRACRGRPPLGFRRGWHHRSASDQGPRRTHPRPESGHREVRQHAAERHRCRIGRLRPAARGDTGEAAGPRRRGGRRARSGCGSCCDYAAGRSGGPLRRTARGRPRSDLRDASTLHGT